MRSPSSRMSRGASTPLVGSITRPLLISSMGRILSLEGVHRAGGHQEKQPHADRGSIGDLFQHAGLRAVGTSGINFETPDYGAGMQHERIGPRQAQALRCELVLQDVLIERER